MLSRSWFAFILGVVFGLGHLREAHGDCDAPGYTSNALGVSPLCKVNQSFYGPIDISGTVAYEMGYAGTDATNKQWPVCGAGRIPVSGDGQYIVPAGATTTYPNARDSATFGSETYRFVKTQGSTQPDYGYFFDESTGTRCACLSDAMSPRNAGSSPPAPLYTADTTRTVASPHSNMLRLYPSTYEDVTSAGGEYGPVPVSTALTDPRNYNLMNPASGTPTSVCSCPNINERAQPIHASDPLTASKCVPMVSPVPTPGYPDTSQLDSPRVLATYAGQSAFFSSHRMSAWHENPLPLTATPEIVRLPTAGDLRLNLPYSRKIWTCSAPYELDPMNGVCAYKRASHPCSKSSPGVVRSPYVESDPSVVQTDAGFERLVNKKLACCINSHEVNSAGSTVGTFIKYDYVQTRESDPSGAPLDFNALWAASDDPLDGGQMNALGLVNSHGQTITGFYSLKGSRCPLFSEFAGDLTPMRVRPFISANQQDQVTSSTGMETLGSAYPLPASKYYVELKSALQARTPPLSVPTTVQQMNECPILVRAALVARCPTYSSSLPFVSVRDPTLTTLVRCPVAASLMIHLRIEQLYEIAGSAPLKRFDTRASKDQIASLDVAELIASKTGNSCWPGTHKEGDICVY